MSLSDGFTSCGHSASEQSGGRRATALLHSSAMTSVATLSISMTVAALIRSLEATFSRGNVRRFDFQFFSHFLCPLRHFDARKL
ncbi:unnamed protein product [Linum tenue]|uniref:Uncharacterized protein n=1 Tax=Linum tenue TaxID=586396 RepID=A0AAV0J8X6_9ROSI|nr:unnamed protein product [Linum tenue]